MRSPASTSRRCNGCASAESGHLQMFAIARRTAWNDVFPRLRAIRDGIELR